MFANVVLGIIGLALGFLLIYKAYYINKHILFLGWAEKKFGRGYGAITYRWIGFALMILSIFVMIGEIDLAGDSGINRQQTTPVVQPSRAPTGVQIAP